jgi:hypothetical protein
MSTSLLTACDFCRLASRTQEATVFCLWRLITRSSLPGRQSEKPEQNLPYLGDQVGPSRYRSFSNLLTKRCRALRRDLRTIIGKGAGQIREKGTGQVGAWIIAGDRSDRVWGTGQIIHIQFAPRSISKGGTGYVEPIIETMDGWVNLRRDAGWRSTPHSALQTARRL